MAAASALAKEPSLIKQLFVENSVSETSFYTVNLFIEGAKTPVIVDHYLPIDKYSGNVIFTRSDDNELWISLLEKAFAKSHGSYEIIEGGLGLEAFAVLTGAPSTEVNP